jgi:hypothetical protein
MDYVESITSWGYADLEEAVRRAQLPDGGRPHKGLHDLVSGDQELNEAEFVDAVSRNLRLGRGLFFIVGDGIREETEALTAHLQAILAFTSPWRSWNSPSSVSLPTVACSFSHA